MVRTLQITREKTQCHHMGYFFPIQVRSECLSCCSALLSWAQVAYVKERKLMGEGLRGRGTACTGGYKGEQAVRPSD